MVKLHKNKKYIESINIDKNMTVRMIQQINEFSFQNTVQNWLITK